MSTITIRSPNSPAEFRDLQEVQRRAWGIVDDSYILPLSTMISVHYYGGIVLGAFTLTGEAVGLSFGFLGRIHERICLYSQLTGVIPEQQGTGLGTRLKYAQRDFCRAQGIDLIAWAFDPLQARNAHFNIQKLGAISRRLIPDMYGPRTDALNAGVPTDRMIAEWEIDAEPVPTLTDGEIRDLPRVIRPGPFGNRADIPTDAWPPPWSDMPKGPRSLLEIPADINAMRRDRPRDAEYWKRLVTNALIGSFDLGYRVIGFVRSGDRSRYYYVLEPPSSPTYDRELG